MISAARKRLFRTSSVIVVAVACGFVSACSTSEPKGMVNTSTQKRSKEYFAESEYGVKASPRVTDQRTRLPRGGGREMVGKPYQIKGKWYKPKVEQNYSKVGAASWYGDAFHGRLTANGEIYDMTHLTAAHPTMPLPSYARVTNTKNGASVIVRVNDRGPYAHGRIIDLSKRAAQLLDYTHSGVAKVKVDYVGPAPVHGRDDEYLVASYRPNGVQIAPEPSYEEQPDSRVMVAMAGGTPSQSVNDRVASMFPRLTGKRALAVAAPTFVAVTAASTVPVQVMPAAYETTISAPAALGDLILPDFGPIVPERPTDGFLVHDNQAALAIMSYADQRVKRAAGDPFDLVFAQQASEAPYGRDNSASEYVLAGSFADPADAARVADFLSNFGAPVIEKSSDGDVSRSQVIVSPDGRASLDALLEAAWSNGAPDAFVVRP